MAAITRRRSVAVDVGGVLVGGDHPIVVQSMTNTDTADSASTVNQVMALARAGSELVRVTVNTEAAAAAVPKIVDTLDKFGVRVPIIGDFHYNGHLLLRKYPACARALAKYRINPGNVNIGKKHDDNFRTMIEAAIEYGRPVRIGVNWGSLDQSLLTRMMDENSRLAEPRDAREVTLEAIVVSALESAAAAEHYGLAHDRIILSAKVSGVQDLVDVYRALAVRCDYPLHLGAVAIGQRGQRGADGIADAFLQQDGEARGGGHNALRTHAGLGQPQVQRVIAARGQRAVNVDEILHAADFRAQNNLLGTPAEFLREVGGVQRAHYHRFHGNFASILRFGKS